jgi:hypothetical protein
MVSHNLFGWIPYVFHSVRKISMILLSYVYIRAMQMLIRSFF